MLILKAGQAEPETRRRKEARREEGQQKACKERMEGRTRQSPRSPGSPPETEAGRKQEKTEGRSALKRVRGRLEGLRKHEGDESH